MTVQTFLDFLHKNKKFPDYSVICFSGKEYPLLFISHLISFLQKNNSIVERIDVVGTDLSLIKAQISTMNFSGKTMYWLNDVHMLSAKKQQEWVTYMQSYTGPHSVLFFCTDETAAAQMQKSEQYTCIMVPDVLPSADFSRFRFLITDVNNKESKNFATRIASYTPQMTLDMACLFAHYEVVVGKSANDFFTEWAAHIIAPTHSLFLLSQYFFSKKSAPFFQQWSHSAEIYLPPFWATYWADQVWRAYMYVDLMQQKKYAEAKKAQYKLPFSLINRDWSSLHLAELQCAHQFLSSIDFRLKNGGSTVALELFYTKFFENKFRS